MKEKIYVILTGGTICSVPTENGKNQSNASETKTILTDYYSQNSNSPFQYNVDFETKFLKPDILSENMTGGAWNSILKIFREKINYESCKGIIVLHGTDTLAYTASLLSFALAGISVPVCLVSAQLRLGEYINKIWVKEERSNGYDNFRAAVELIMNGIKPNVYAVYRNIANEENGEHEPGELLVHYGSHLVQCPNNSNNFHSRDEMHVPDINNARLVGKDFESKDCLYRNNFEIGNDVIMIKPYSNLNYKRIRLCKIKAVVHGTYHSESVCIGRAAEAFKNGGNSRNDYALKEIVKADRPYSILYLLKKCKNKGVPVFLAPCTQESAAYGTTANAIHGGAIPNGFITIEASYAKAVLGSALGYKGEELVSFMTKDINYELK